MGTLCFSLFHLFIIILQLTFLRTHSTTHWQDSQVLKELKNSIDPVSVKPGSCISSWDFNFDPCDSAFSDKFTCGFRCDVNVSSVKRITELGLDQAGYSGSLTNVSWNMSYLLKLDLSGNYFSGEIPHSFSNLAQVQQIILSRNSLTRSIPNSVGAISSLEELYLDNNYLNGTVPLNFNGLRNLKRLELQGNQFTGEFPSLSQLSNLYFLDVSNNGISGFLPNSFPPGLVELSIRNNSIDGNIPASIINLAYLQALDLSHNHLTGSTPAGLFSHPSLEQLTLSDNKFGSFENPRNSVMDSQLIAIELSNNQIRGFLPVFLIMLPKLSALDLENNKFSGMIPTRYTMRVLNPGQGMSSLDRLLLGGNYLIGPIPGPFLGLQPGSVNLKLGNNCLYRCPLNLFFCEDGDQKSSTECKAFSPFIP